MSWQTLRLTESILLLSIFCDLHILGMHIFVLWTVETQSTLAKNKNYDYLVFYISSGFSPSNSIDFIFLASDFLNIMNSYSTLCFVFMMLCNWTEPLVPSLLMALKGYLPFLWLLSDCLAGHIYLFTAHTDVRLPLGLLWLLFITLKCVRLFSLCMLFRVCFSWRLSLSSLFSFLLSMVCIILVLHMFGLFILLELVMMLFLLWRKSFWVSNTLLDIDAEMIEQFIWMKEQIFLKIFFSIYYFEMKIIET